MATPHTVIGLLGVTLLLARAGFALGRGGRNVRMAVLAAAISLVPIGGLSVSGYVRGVIGDLSITTLFLLGASFVVGLSRRERLAIASLVLSGAVLLYPMALGLGPLDPYRLGFAPHGLLLALLVLAVLVWLCQFYFLLACILAGVAGHALGILESSNLWDYVLDPWIAVASIYDLWLLRRNS